MKWITLRPSSPSRRVSVRQSAKGVLLPATVLVVGALASPGTAVGDVVARVPLVKVGDIRLDGGSSRFDYLSIDPDRRRLYLAHLGASRVTVIDLRTRTLVGSVTGVSDVHGVLVVPELRRLFATATGANELVTIDTRTRRVLARTPTGAFPDGLAYDPTTRRVFVSGKEGGDVTVVSAVTSKTVGRIPLGDDVGNVQYDRVAARMLVVVGSRNEVVAVDPKRLRVLERIRLPGCLGAHGLSLDPLRRAAFVACEFNARLIVLDLARGKAIAQHAVGEIPDVLAFDPGLRRLYVASESGVVTVFAENARRLRRLGQSLVAPGAHAVAVDPRTHLVYFPLEDVNGRPVLRVMRPRSG